MKKHRLTEHAVKNHEDLFPNHESKLQKTDPEFIELFDNWRIVPFAADAKRAHPAATRMDIRMTAFIQGTTVLRYKTNDKKLL